jgi:hypothetical protein
MRETGFEPATSTLANCRSIENKNNDVHALHSERPIGPLTPGADSVVLSFSLTSQVFLANIAQQITRAIVKPRLSKRIRRDVKGDFL